MEFGEFERFVLGVLFETRAPATAAQIAYQAGVSVRTAERHLARMVEDGGVLIRSNADGQIEYFVSHSRARTDADGARRRARAPAGGLAQPSNPLTAVMLSVLIPGAGHIYAGRSGAGVAWMATTLAGYACYFLPGLLLHGLCLVSAASTRKPTT